MALEGYPSIEPLGGCKDKGRDAIHVNQSGGKTTIFCYSVREDWRTKLDQDAATIHKHKHRCHRLAYLSTEDYTPGDRDKAAKFIKQTYGWTLSPTAASVCGLCSPRGTGTSSPGTRISSPRPSSSIRRARGRLPAIRSSSATRRRTSPSRPGWPGA